MTPIIPPENSIDIVGLIKSLSPYITWGVITAVMLAIFKGLKFWGSVEEKFKSTDKMNETMLKISENISTITGRLNFIEGRFEKMDGGLTAKHSPISLTPKGKEFAKEENIEVHVNNIWESIKTFIDNACIGLNPYDIQEFIFKIALIDLQKLIDKEGFEKLKLRAYNEGLTIEEIGKVVGVIVRDRYIKEKGISHDEIDKCDPTKKSN